MLLLHAGAPHAQELEPRTYSPSPIGTNFLLAGYAHLSGDVLTDPSLPVSGVNARINNFVLGYVHTFALAGRTASLGLAVPFMSGDLSGLVIGAPTEVHRAGLGDMQLRFALNLIGNPALSPEAFAQAPAVTSLGASLTVQAPTGQYIPTRLVNVGNNRWAFKPEIGVSQPWGNWFFEASLGVWLFTSNTDFFNGQNRSQAPLAITQLHGGYSFRPGLWLAFDIGYASGGATSVNDGARGPSQGNARGGLTLAMPLGHGWSAKLAYSRGFITRAAGDYQIVTVALQYRWFDR
ncbi:transporter [Paraburkholderia unamae]|uniref:Outer membrane putative beta-barrel porin/alpha-amylase n=1 Tax=Paraburkholderia unamae TaxID=219649 RepID=A0ABX5KHB0_9BURK|nr:transporter [Paraburkholderia unamae]PVX76274.1 outer membrane putative beta-barrel porin/alpha-amylase [Paraburkholderia unamae]RAR58324.1 outer membrane putative beta-barrel porin/alpha-amylase [Paraburkholderia unamae]